MDKTGTTLLNGHPYTPSHLTDIRDTWRRFGWAPKKTPAHAGGMGEAHAGAKIADHGRLDDGGSPHTRS